MSSSGNQIQSSNPCVGMSGNQKLESQRTSNWKSLQLRDLLDVWVWWRHVVMNMVLEIAQVW
jgi:hypothetical protein